MPFSIEKQCQELFHRLLAFCTCSNFKDDSIDPTLPTVSNTENPIENNHLSSQSLDSPSIPDIVPIHIQTITNKDHISKDLTSSPIEDSIVSPKYPEILSDDQVKIEEKGQSYYRRSSHLRLSSLRPSLRKIEEETPEVESLDLKTINNRDVDYSNVQLKDLTIISTIAMGTFSNVKLVKYNPLNTSLALKEVSKRFLERTRKTNMILREKEVHIQLDHPFIAKLFKTFQTKDCVYFLMEYLPGRDLWKLMSKEIEFENGFSVNVARFFGACTVDALEYLHQKNIMYRDIKLENIVLDQKGYPRIVDFGFATTTISSSSNNLSKHTTFCGSPEYMAPEILLHENHDEMVDIWSFGILMYEMLLGITPFYSQNDFDCQQLILKDEVLFPDEFEKKQPLAVDLILLLLQKDPIKRRESFPNGFQSIKEHPFFSIWLPYQSDWDDLTSYKLIPPFNPDISDPFDLSRFSSINDLDDYIEPYDGRSSWAEGF